MKRRPPESNRAGSFLVILGLVTVLGVAFGAGVFVGRHWPRLLPSLGSGAVARAEREAAARREARLGERSRASEPAPVLTFYQELTAPLTAPPPVPRPKKAEAPKLEAPPPPSGEPPPPEPGPAADRRFTIQVGAFKTRAQAEAMRALLADAGHEAYVAELEGVSGARYRVRVGAFASREEAREMAERLSTERQFPSYVTIR
ncbi:MAG: hypothetical protein AUH29_07220 [Candidatus Rokubacteria bacterium 13_1_40CM_69_27]|nr:MAG: hypothetical protein AUH29_07220 [Candidatus Rokubacteria bacterium 13_1_40CM_69_27]